MNQLDQSHKTGLWVYTILTVVVLNVDSLIIFGGYYALQAVQPELAARIPLGVVPFLFIDAVEWIFALALITRLRREGRTLGSLINLEGTQPLRAGPFVLVFLASNAIFAAYMGFTWISGQWPAPVALPPIWLALYIPFTALSPAFVEELIWRGYVIPQMEARGRSGRAAVLLSALSFALIHGVFLPGRLVMALLIGIIHGLYFVKERRVLPLMAVHAALNLWSFAVFTLIHP